MAGLARDDNQQYLLRNVAEELKLPLLQIAREAELAGLTETFSLDTLKKLQHGANAALELIDSYMLGLQLSESQQTLELEPVSIASVLTDTAHSLHDLAKHYDVGLELDLKGAGEPVMAHAGGLKSAMFSLGYALIEAQAKPAEEGRPVLTLTTYRGRAGTVAGIYGHGAHELSEQHFREAVQLYGRARQPFSLFSGTSAAGIFVAQNILEAMSVKLKASRHHKQSGFAAVLQPSHQLQLI